MLNLIKATVTLEAAYYFSPLNHNLSFLHMQPFAFLRPSEATSQHVLETRQKGERKENSIKDSKKKKNDMGDDDERGGGFL